jgi:hypothetical protein
VTTAAGGRIEDERAVGTGVATAGELGAPAGALDGALDGTGVAGATPTRATPFGLEPAATADGSGMRREPEARLAGRGGRGGPPATSRRGGGRSSIGTGGAPSLSSMLESAAIVLFSGDRIGRCGHSRE